MKKKTFSWRAFVSFGLFMAFLMLLVSGTILYLAPPGRVANWTNWQILGLGKSDWQNQHNVFALSFVILSIFHLFFINWKAFWSYIKTKTHEGLARPLEITGILVLSVFFVTGTYLKITPFSAVIDFGEYLSSSWEDPQNKPPVPHTEKMTLREISATFIPGKSPVELQKTLEAQSINVKSVDQTLEDIGKKNNISAQKVYERLGISSASKPGTGRGQGKKRQ